MWNETNQSRGLFCSNLLNASAAQILSILRHQRALATVLLIVLFPVCFCLFVNASSGDFDSAFGGTGKVITDFGATTDYGDAVVLQPDGKIVIAGTAIANYAAPDQRSNFALARYNANGSLDDSFGAGGRVITDFNGGEHDGVGDMVLQSDGRLVVAGSVLAPGGGGIDLGLARYLSDGSLDPNFGSSGKVATHLSGRISGASGMVLQPDGKLVIAGQTGESTRSDIAVVRYNNNGSLDTSFGNGGQVTTHFDGGSNVSVSASDIALQPDGKIVVAGHYIQDYSVAAVFALARYNFDGSLDSGFADGGKLITNVTGFADGVVVQPDGKIIAAGHIRVAQHDNDIELARYNGDGSSDSSFGVNGLVKTTFSTSTDDLARTVMLQPNGKILVGGHTGNYPRFDFALVRYNTNGQLDSSFGNNGKVSTDFSGQWEEVSAVAVQPDGQILAAGECECPAGLDFAVVRYIGESAPTANSGIISGRITTSSGTPVAGVVMRLTGTQSRKAITNDEGLYRFENVETNGFYTVTPARSNYSFSPATRSFNQAGNQTEAAFAGQSMGDNLNPSDTAEYFVRQQYVDILNREPDEAGFNYWSDHILACGQDVECTRAQRTAVAAAFFIENEFRQSGAFIYNMYESALGRHPAYVEYSADRTKVVVGGATLDTQKLLFAEAFVGRADFVNRYQNNMTADSFVDAMLANAQEAGIDLNAQRNSLIARYNSGAGLTESRALVLRDVTESAAVRAAHYNAAFVEIEYFGYLHRNPDAQGRAFWLNVLNESTSNGNPSNYSGMVCSFITSTEYQRRFSVIVSHSNTECGQ